VPVPLITLTSAPAPAPAAAAEAAAAEAAEAAETYLVSRSVLTLGEPPTLQESSSSCRSLGEKPSKRRRSDAVSP
jgi:hypothetical protein